MTAVWRETTGRLGYNPPMGILTEDMRRVLDEPALLERLQSGILPVRTLAEEVTLLERVYDGVRTPAADA